MTLGTVDYLELGCLLRFEDYQFLEILLLVRACAFAFSLAMTTPALGYSGNDLFSDLKSDSGEGVFAYGYIIGTTDILDLMGLYESCYKLPDGVTYEQKIDVVKNHLERNPQDRHLEAKVIIFFAMSDAFGRYDRNSDMIIPFCPR